MIFERYDDAVVDAVTNPFTGIQSRYRSPPPIAAILEACEAEKTRANFKSDWDRRSAEQLRERELAESQDNRESLEHRRAVVKRLWPQANKTDHTDRAKWTRFSEAALKAMYGGHEKATSDQPVPADDLSA